MREVRDIVARMLAGPQPPLREAAEVLQRARRANRRRSWVQAAGAGGVVLVLAFGVGAVVGPAPWGGTARPHVEVAAPPVPAARAAPAHGQRMAQTLRTAVPAGFAAAPAESFSDSAVVNGSAAPGRVRLLAATVVRVFAGAGEGELYAYLVHDGGLAPDDVCAPRLVGGVDSCDVRLVNRATVRVVTRTDATRGRQIEATRFLAGGRLVVGTWQGPPDDPTRMLDFEGRVTWWRPPLDGQLLDVDTVAGLAADPAMLSE